MGAVSGDGLFEEDEVEAAFGVGGDLAQAVCAEAGDVECLGDGVVDCGGGVAGERGGGDALGANLEAEGVVARDDDGDEVGRGGAGDEEAGGGGGEVEELAGPGGDLAFDLDGAGSRPPRLALRPAASIPASMPTEVPAPWTQPMKPGWTLPTA